MKPKPKERNKDTSPDGRGGKENNTAYDFSDLSDEEIDEKIQRCRDNKKEMEEQGDDLINQEEAQ